MLKNEKEKDRDSDFGTLSPMQNHGDAAEFLISHNGRKDRNEAQDVNRIPRNQLKSKKQLETKRKIEKEECLRAQRKEEETEK